VSVPAVITATAFTLRELVAGRYIFQHPRERRVFLVLQPEQLLEDPVTVHGGLLDVLLAAESIQI